MDLSTISADDFKDLFYRDFAYLPEYDNTKTYFLGDIVYYSDTGNFYKVTTIPSTSDFDSGDFDSGDFDTVASANSITGILPTNTAVWTVTNEDSTLNYVLDADITRAQAEAEMQLNQSLFSQDSHITLAYNYLTAHYLVNDLRAAKGGLNSKPNFIVSSKTAGSVSESYAIPDAFKSDPIVQFYSQTAYGNKYLSMVLPRMVGNVVAVAGATQA